MEIWFHFWKSYLLRVTLWARMRHTVLSFRQVLTFTSHFILLPHKCPSDAWCSPSLCLWSHWWRWSSFDLWWSAPSQSGGCHCWSRPLCHPLPSGDNLPWVHPGLLGAVPDTQDVHRLYCYTQLFQGRQLTEWQTKTELGHRVKRAAMCVLLVNIFSPWES